MGVTSIDLALSEDLRDELEGGAEEVLTEFGPGIREGEVEMGTLQRRVNDDGDLGGKVEGTLGTLAMGRGITEVEKRSKEKRTSEYDLLRREGTQRRVPVLIFLLDIRATWFTRRLLKSSPAPE